MSASDTPRTPVPPWLIDALVRLGVRRETALGYSLRQAHGVRDKLLKRKQNPPPARAETPSLFGDET